jgi:hypothetical protein
MRPIAALLVFLLCAMVPAFAQDTARLPVVGVLRIDTTPMWDPLVIRDALKALGYVDCKKTSASTPGSRRATPNGCRS